ncbi:MAG: glycosyl transferase family 1 [Proteobacteria bacterium]|nr:MAG: glycosyl transferase family 1 [Pseudomonadota bacterium]
MRILMISDVYFPRINGVSTSIQTFRRSLHAAGHETVLVAPEYPAIAHGVRQEAAEGEILRVPSRYVPRDPEDRMMKIGALRAVQRVLAQRSFDLVHIQTPFVAHYQGTAIARRLGVPVIESYHTYFEEYLHHYVPLMPRRLMRFVARRFTVSQCNVLDGLVVPSRPMQMTLARYGVRAPMRIIPTGMEMQRLQRGDGARFRARLNIEPGRPTLVHVGRIAHEKNVDFLFRMMRHVVARKPEAVLIVAGEGPALGRCKVYARSLGLVEHVRFVGYLSRDSELLDCYCAGDLFVFASKTETQGLVLLEAMALGIPVVSTAYMGTEDIVRPQRGACLAPDDEEGFAAIVLALLDDPRRRAELAVEARRYAATWSADAMAARLEHFYAEIVERGARWRRSSAASRRAQDVQPGEGA